MQTAWDTDADAAAFETAATTALGKAQGVSRVLPGAGGKTRWVLVADGAGNPPEGRRRARAGWIGPRAADG